MALSDRITRGIQQKPLRTVLYGIEGIGKSSFAAQFPQSISLAAEDGTSLIDTSRVVPNGWNDCLTLMSELHADQSGEFKTINIDTLGWVCDLALRHVCAQEGVRSLEEIAYGRWKGMMAGEFKKFMDWVEALYYAGYNINFVAHADVSAFKNPEGEDYDRYSIALKFPDIADRVRQWVDVVGFMKFDTSIVEIKDGMRTMKKAQSNNARRLYLQRTAAFDAKNRFSMPEFIDLGQSPEAGFARFWDVLSKARASLAKESSPNPPPKPAGKKAKTSAPPAPAKPPAAPASTSPSPPPKSAAPPLPTQTN